MASVSFVVKLLQISSGAGKVLTLSDKHHPGCRSLTDLKRQKKYIMSCWESRYPMNFCPIISQCKDKSCCCIWQPSTDIFNLPISFALVTNGVTARGSVASLVLATTAAAADTEKQFNQKYINKKHKHKNEYACNCVPFTFGQAKQKNKHFLFTFFFHCSPTFSGFESSAHCAVEAALCSFFYIFLWVETLTRGMKPSVDKRAKFKC